MRISDFLRDLGRPVAYFPNLARAVGGVKETIFLCQLLYWTGKQHDKEGWIFKTQKEITLETGLSRREQETARRNLKKLKILEEKYQGIPRKLYFKVNFDELNLIWEKFCEKNKETVRHTIMYKPYILGCTNRTCRDEQNVHAITYNTTETTQNNNSKSSKPNYIEWVEQELNRVVRDKLEKYKQTYPEIDIEREKRKAILWLQSNPKKQKKDLNRFFLNWLNRVDQGRAKQKNENTEMKLWV